MALKKINVQFQRSKSTAIIGQNGSGKSTLAFHLVGILNPTNPEGQLIVDGLDVQNNSSAGVDSPCELCFSKP